MAEPTNDERMTQIRDRNRRLLAVPFETHGGDIHGPGCPPCELVRGIGDVSWLLERLALADGLQQRWGAQAEHSTSAFLARSREQAQQMAAMNSRVHEPGCLPTPYHVVTRLEGAWQRVEAGEQQPEGGDRG